MATQDDRFEMAVRVADDLMSVLVHVVQSSVVMHDVDGKEIGVFINEKNWLAVLPKIIKIQEYLKADMEAPHG